MSRSKFEAGEASQHEVVEIESSWVEEVLDNIKSSQQRKCPAKPSIFRIPQHLRLGHEHAYEPKLVSIGPYHHGNPRLQAMEEIKWQILHHLSEASKDNIPRCLKKMQDSEAEARRYYSEVINMESRKFAEMLLLDGYFIIQLLSPREKMAEELQDLLQSSIYFGGPLLQDLLLLENQLPYFIFNDLLSVLNIQEVASVVIKRDLLTRSDQIMPAKFFRVSSIMEPKEDSKMAHLLHLLHESYPEPSGPQSPPNQQLVMETSDPEFGSQSVQQSRSRSRCPLRQFVLRSTSRSRCPISLQFLQRSRSRLRCPISLQCLQRSSSRQRGSLNPDSPVGVPSLTELVDAGVKIKVREVDNFLDISFNKKNGLLEIPAIDVQDNTNLIFRNLIALEQCYTVVGMKITWYSIFMDSIIDTEKDVALLRQEGIIGDRCLNDKDIAFLFNELCKDVVFDVDNNYLALLFKEVNDYCNSRWNRWRARLMHDYFSNPWAILSLIAGAVLLVLTLVQTVFSVLSYTQQIHSSDKPHP